MAEAISMKHPMPGIIKKGFIGYSWTMLFFQPLAPLFRKDFSTANILSFLIVAQTYIFTQSPVFAYIPPLIVIACITYPGFVGSFFWNKHYTAKFLSQGYDFAESEEKNNWAAIELGKNNPAIAKALGWYVGILFFVVFVYTEIIN